MRNPGLSINQVCLLVSNCSMTKAIFVTCKFKVPFFKYWSSIYCNSTNCTLLVAEQHLLGGLLRGNCPGIVTPDSVESLFRRFRMSASFFASPQTIAAARMTDTISPSPQTMATVVVAGVKILPLHWREEGCKRPTQGLCTLRAEKHKKTHKIKNRTSGTFGLCF